MNQFVKSAVSVFFLISSLRITPSHAAPLTVQEKALHVLNRFAYGPAYGQLEKMSPITDQSLEQWFEDQMSQTNANEALLSEKLKSLKSLKYTNREMLKRFPLKAMMVSPAVEGEDVGGGPRTILKELSAQKVVRGVNAENQFEEVMVGFWFNHFNIHFDKGLSHKFLTSYERDVIRPHVFGKFEDLLSAVVKSPAMLAYLDNFKSNKDEINENYARELLELHTLGVDGGYTEKDIQEAARVLTGWGIMKPLEVGEYRFSEKQHDSHSKKVMELTFSGSEGELEGEKLISYLANHKSTAQFIAHKLAVKFINDQPSQATIDALADVFLKTKGDLKQVYRAIYKSTEFWSEKSIKSKIKMPFEYVITAARALNVQSTAEVPKKNPIRNFLDQSGEFLYRCQSPAGYKTISGYWINPGAMVGRINFAMTLARHKIPQLPVDMKALLSRYNDQKFQKQIDVLNVLNKDIFAGQIKDETLQQIDRQIEDGDDVKKKKSGERTLRSYPNEKILALMLSSPEFQRR